MKVTFIQVEGTADELDASEVGKQLIAAMGVGPAPVSRLTVEDDAPANNSWQSLPIPGLAAEGQAEVKKLLTRNPAAEQFISFLKRTTSWPNATLHGVKRKTHQEGEPLDYSDYLRLRRQGSQLGGFAYVYADTGVVNLRLNYDSDAGILHSFAPDAYIVPKGHRAYRVSVQITDESTLRQALELAEMAYKLT
ncbi:hypothetical protein [Kitasatospora sp. NPDC089509]|uniref:hypothetical protein n=1 Tax=Kitasatospora sp. NPDC089509 TaxID=3364079 RepID=UPI00380DDB3F